MIDWSSIQAVAFDLDGTLVDSVPDLAASANAMRTALGLPELTRETLQSFVGDGLAVMVHRVLTNDYNGRADEALWQRGFAEFVRHYGANLANATRPFPETEATLQLLRKLELPLAVITNKSELLTVKLLKELNLDAYFSMVVGGDTLPERKPDAAPLLYVAEILGVEPKNMLMVGDSHNDMLAAKAAGCPVVGVSFGYGDMTQLAKDVYTAPDVVVNTLPEIFEALKQHAL